MAIDAGSAVGYLDLDITGFLRNLRTAQSEANNTVRNMVTNIGDRMQGVGKQLSSVGTTMMKTVTTPVVGIGTAVVKVTTFTSRSRTHYNTYIRSFTCYHDYRVESSICHVVTFV